MSANLEDLYVDHVLQHFNLWLFVNKGDKILIRYLFEEEDSSQCLKISSQFTVKKTKIYKKEP